MVVTPVSSMSTIVEHRKTGFVCDDFTMAEVLKGLNWYKTLSKVELGELAGIASNRVQGHFSGEVLKNNWLAFFN